jgi:hypothetical protein
VSDMVAGVPMNVPLLLVTEAAFGGYGGGGDD